MKKIYIIRHAKSSWDDPELDDFHRPLNKRGEKDAPRMGKRLKEKGITPDIVISSPAIRAMETCKTICRILGYDRSKIIENQKLYHASEEQILELVQGVKDRFHDYEENLWLFGHNPGLTDFSNLLFNEHIDNIPTTGIVCGHLEIKKWKDATWGCGKLLFFDFPKRKEL